MQSYGSALFILKAFLFKFFHTIYFGHISPHPHLDMNSRDWIQVIGLEEKSIPYWAIALDLVLRQGLP